MSALEAQYWVRNEQGRVWGPYTAVALERLRGQISEKWSASTDGKAFRIGTEFPELQELLRAPRVVRAPVAAEPEPVVDEAEARDALRAAARAAMAAERARKAVSSPGKPKPEAAEAQPAQHEVHRSPPAPQPAPPPPDAPLTVPEEGELEKVSPVRLYALAALTSVSGWLQLTSETGRMLQVSFRRGTPEHLESDDPELSLLRHLIKRGTITPQQGHLAEEHGRTTGADVVTVLFQLQLIPPAEAHKLLGEHMLALLDRALITWRGRFSFEAEAPPPPGAFPLGQRWTLLAEAMRRLDPAPLRARLGKRLIRPVLRSGGLGIGRVEELALTAQESRLYAAIDGVRTGDELLKSQDPAITLRLLYLLLELGHLAFGEEPEPVAAPAAPTPAPGAGSAAVPPAVAAPEGGKLPPRQPAPRPVDVPRGPPPVVAQIAAPQPGSPPSGPPPRPTPAPQPPARPAAPPFGSIAASLVAPPDETPPQQLARLEGVAQAMDKATHFEVLGLERKATAGESKKAFFVLARELHPDTVSDGNVPLRALKERLFSRVNEASQVLADEKRRKEYEEELDGKAGNVDVARIFAAEEAFQRGEIMIKARKYADGLKLLEEAITLNDQEAEFYAWRGWARFLIAKDRKSQHADSVADCKKALSMVAVCLPAWLFLANMAKALGDLKEAERGFKKVLELDAKHVEAQRELRLMGAAKK